MGTEKLDNLWLTSICRGEGNRGAFHKVIVGVLQSLYLFIVDTAFIFSHLEWILLSLALESLSIDFQAQVKQDSCSLEHVGLFGEVIADDILGKELQHLKHWEELDVEVVLVK